jgi:hypothetical protein
MDPEAFAAELGDRFVYCPHCHRTHLWTKAIAWLEAAAGDEHRHDASPHARVKSILIAEDHDRVAELFADLFALSGWIATTYREGQARPTRSVAIPGTTRCS